MMQNACSECQDPDGSEGYQEYLPWEHKSRQSHTDRMTDRQIHRQNDRQTDTQTDRHTDRQIHRKNDRQTETQIE